MATTTEALVLREINGPFSIEQIELDKLQPDEALVDIHASGLCHTDLSCANGTLPAGPNAVFGHEGGGIILETGANVKNVQKGDKVLLSFAHCETCKQCTSGHPAYCYSFMPLNFGGARPDGSKCYTLADGKQPMHGSFFGQSSFSRKALVHKSCIVKVPADTDLAKFSPLGCGLQTGAGSIVNSLKVTAGSSVVVFGVGSVGMSAVMAAKIVGAKTIIAVDLQPARLELAKEFGATHGILGSAEDLVQQIQQICPPNGADFAVDCSGVPQVVDTMIEVLGTRGKAATVGAPSPGKKAGVDILNHLLNGREYIGCCEGDAVPSKFIPWLMQKHAEGAYPFDRLITVYNFKDYETAIHDAHSGKTIKAVLKW